LSRVKLPKQGTVLREEVAQKEFISRHGDIRLTA
jgi:hypothetical protein